MSLRCAISSTDSPIGASTSLRVLPSGETNVIFGIVARSLDETSRLPAGVVAGFGSLLDVPYVTTAERRAKAPVHAPLGERTGKLLQVFRGGVDHIPIRAGDRSLHPRHL